MTPQSEAAFRRELEDCRRAVEDRLETFFTERTGYTRLTESMRYSLLAGGKRLRAVICIKLCEAAGGTQADALDAACAIEMLHAYSLIHDDLPCMDNAATRRGKASNHIAFGEFTATLAGDALQAAAFETILSLKLPPCAVVEIGKTLARAAGPHGICGGQQLDMLGGKKLLTEKELREIHSLKTAALISAAARIGVLAAGGSEEQLAAAESYAQSFGLAFQARDDLLDLISTDSELGKPTGADAANEKTTFASLFGQEGCLRIIREETEKAAASLERGFDGAHFLIWLARIMEERKC